MDLVDTTPAPAPAADNGGDAGGFLGMAPAPAQQAPEASDGGPAPAAGTPEIAGAADPDWYGQLSADGDGENPANRDVVKAKGWKTLDDVVKSYREAERALRDQGRVKVPGEGASEAEMSAFRKAIGVPEKAEDYALPTIKGADGQPVDLDTERLGEIAGIAHKHGIPKKALEGVLQDLAEADALRLSSSDAQMQEQVDQHLKSWGNRQAEKVANINAAARELGLTREEQVALRAALGPSRALDLFADLGGRLAEDTMTMAGQRRNFGLSGAEAQATLSQKMSNPEWTAKTMIPGTAERAEYDRLQAAIGAAADRAAFEASRG